MVDWLSVLVESLASVARRTASPGAVHTYIGDRFRDVEYVPLVFVEAEFGGAALREQGVALCSTPQGPTVEAYAPGSLSRTESSAEACARAGGRAVADGHLHPFQAAIPSYGDLRSGPLSELRGRQAMCIGRARERGGSRVLCVEADPFFTEEDLEGLSGIREEVENSDRMDPEFTILAAVEGEEMPAHLPVLSEEDAEGDEQLFCEMVNNYPEHFDEVDWSPSGIRCRIIDQDN